MRSARERIESIFKMPPFFLITIDTEEDNAWSRAQTVTTRNSKFIPRFQALCESYGLKPTYLTNYEMAGCPDFREFGKDILKRQTGEIGMHLHAWNSPPHYPLTENDNEYHPYLIEYPEKIMEAKIDFMTNLLEQTFGVKMVSHRAGRWSFNETYARILHEKGYLVDTSVTPHVSWKDTVGDPRQSGGTDFRFFPEKPYFLDLEDISKPGNSTILEAPVTISSPYARVNKLRSFFHNNSIPWRVLNRIYPHVSWLRPNRNNLNRMIKILNHAVKAKRETVVFMLHSSELMPGGSPTFPEERDIEKLYGGFKRLFAAAQKHFKGATLKEVHHVFSRRYAVPDVLQDSRGSKNEVE